jgi:hypothetical protein
MSEPLPTGDFVTWKVRAFRDGIVDALAKDTRSDELRLYFYAVTLPGWLELRTAALSWVALKRGARSLPCSERTTG